MTGVRKSLNLTQADAITEALSAESCHIVLEASPPDYVEKISRYLESSVTPSRLSNDPAEAESDSGDSLFLTQKPVPEAVRAGRRRHYSLRSDQILTSPRDAEDSEDDISLTASHRGSKTVKKGRKIKYELPKYSFPFLADRKWKSSSTLLSAQQNITLHNSMMGGFFKCVRELWDGYQRGEDLGSSLPTVDKDGESISPLSEEEEEEESEDIKVVARKRFAAPVKAKHSRPLFTPEKRDSRAKPQKRGARDSRREMSQRRQRTTSRKTPLKALISRLSVSLSDTESTDDEDPSRRVLAERETSDKHVTSDRTVAQTETPRTKRRLTGGSQTVLSQEKEREKELCDDSDATVCSLPLNQQGSPREYTLKSREASPNVTELQTDVFLTDDVFQTGQTEDEPESQSLLQGLPDLVSHSNNDRVHNETMVKKKKNKKAKGDGENVEEEEGQSQEEAKGLHASASVNVEAKEMPSLSEDSRAEPPASQTSDEPERNEENWMENSSRDDFILRQEERHNPDSKQMKKRRKKNKSAADSVRQEEDGNLESDVRLEDSSFSVTCNMVNSSKKKKKKRKSIEDDEGVEQLQSSSQSLHDDAETQRKKKKRKKDKKIVDMEENEEEEAQNLTSDLRLMAKGHLEGMGNCLENTEASQETVESRYNKKRKRQLSASHDDAHVGAEDGVDVNSSHDATLQGQTTRSVKKKKKKKKRESISEGVVISYTPDKNHNVYNADKSQETKEGPDDQDAELVTKKKKKKKKKSETFSRNIPEDTAAQSDDSVSVRKKEKKRTSSFLAADAEEKAAQTHEEQSSPSKSVAAHVWGAEKPSVSAGDVETESAEIAGNLEAPIDGVRKRKRKRKMSVEQESVEKDHEQDFEEPKETCQSAVPETTDTGVKRKKKHKRNESEPVERLESAADAGCSQPAEAMALMKKKKKKKKKGRDEPCGVTEDSPPTATDRAESEAATLTTSVSHKKQVKQAEEPMNMTERASPSSDTPGNPAFNDARDKKKKKKKIKATDSDLLEERLLTESAETETEKTEKTERNKLMTVRSFTSSSCVLSETSPSQFEMSSSDSVVKNKRVKTKRRLHNPNEDFLTEN